MKIQGFLFDKQKAELFDEAAASYVDIANMSLKEKEDWIKIIPKDFRLDNDMQIYSYILWTRFRERLIKLGYFVRDENPSQMKLDDIEKCSEG